MPARSLRSPVAALRAQRGASLTENGLLVGLVAVAAIFAIGLLGERTRNTFCVAALELGAPVACLASSPPPVVDPVAPAPEPEEPEDPEAPVAPLTLAFDVPGAVFDLEDPQAMRFTVGGLRDHAAFDWRIADVLDDAYLSDSGHIAGSTAGIAPDAAVLRPGRNTVAVTAPLPDGSIASAPPIVRELVTMAAFPDDEGNEPEATVVSEALPVIGLESLLEATLDTGVLLVNGEPAAQPATIGPGDAIAVELVTPAAWNTATTATLSVGPLTRTFTAATRPESVTLLELAFKDVTLAMPGEVYMSKSVKVRGVAAPMAVFLDNGAEISINNGPWSDSATLGDNDAVRLRMTASETSLGVATTTVSVGGSGYPWTITTADLASAPPAYAQIHFAPTVGANPDTPTASPRPRLIFAPAGYSVVRIAAGGDEARFRANSGRWTTGPLLVRNGSALQLLDTSASDPFATRTTTLSIGSRSASWDLTTRDLIRTPSAFAFAQQVNQEPGVEVRSAPARLSGHEIAIPVGVSSGFEIRNVTADNATGSEAWAASVTVAPGESIQLRTTTGSYATSATGTVTAGSRTVTWSVSVRAADVLPNAFAFPAVSGVAPNALAEVADTVTISGIDIPVPVSSQVTGGTASAIEFQINGGAWASSGMVADGQTLKVRATAPNGYALSSDIRIAVGGRNTVWRIATTAGNVTPDGIAPASITNAIPDKIYYSERFVIGGLDSPATLRTSTTNCRLRRYSANGNFSGNGFSWSYANGDTLEVQYRASSSLNTTATCTVTIDGGGSFTFRITTTNGQAGSFTLSVPDIADAEFGASYAHSFIVEDLPTPVVLAIGARSFSASSQTAAIPTIGVLVNGNSVGSGRYIQNGDEVTITTTNGTITSFFGGVGTMSATYGNKTATWTIATTDGLKATDAISLPAITLAPSQIQGRHVVTDGFDGYARVEALDGNTYVRGRTSVSGTLSLGSADPTSTTGMAGIAGNRAGDMAILQVRAANASSFPFGASGISRFRVGSQLVEWPWQAIAFVPPGSFTVDDLTLPGSGSTVQTPVAGFTPSNGPFTITASASRAGVTPVVYRRVASNGSILASTSFDQTHDGVSVRLTRSQFPAGTTTMITLTVSSAFAPDYSTSFLVTAP